MSLKIGNNIFAIYLELELLDFLINLNTVFLIVPRGKKLEFRYIYIIPNYSSHNTFILYCSVLVSLFILIFRP